MKIYTLIHLQDTAITDADAAPFLTKESAQKAMKAAWEEALKAAGIPAAAEVWGQDVTHEWRWWARAFDVFTNRLFS